MKEPKRLPRVNINAVTSEDSYLLRDRPGCDVPVGPEHALRFSGCLSEREVAILAAVEQLGYATADQLSRVFFNSPRAAYEALLPLMQHRYLARLPVPGFMVQSAVRHASPPRNPTYVLDWNGFF